jgi:hypothetical protein
MTKGVAWLAVALLSSASFIEAKNRARQVPCGTGNGLHWGAVRPMGSVGGIEFLVSMTIPQCLGDVQDVAIYTRNMTSAPLIVRFSATFTAIGGLEESQERGGQVNGGTGGDRPLATFSPFHSHLGVTPDPSLLVAWVMLTAVGVCAPPTQGPASAYQGCDSRPASLKIRAECPAAKGDPAYGYSPLMMAAQDGATLTAMQLIGCGADVNARATDGYTALMFAANAGLMPVAEALLRAGANVNARQDNGMTALGIIGDQFPAMGALLRKFGGQK